MNTHPLTDECIAEHWPDMDTTEGRAEIRRQFDALMAQVRNSSIRPFPRHPEAMAQVVVEKARQLPERLEIVKAALAGLPEHWRQWQWSADAKPAFGDRFVRSTIVGDNGHGFGRQWIACVNHASKNYVGTLADFIAAANPDTVGMMVARIEQLEAVAPDVSNHVGNGMAIAAGIIMRIWGDDTRAREILNAAGFDSIDALRANGVEQYDIEALTPIFAASPAPKAAPHEKEKCPVCAVALHPEDICATDIELGICHAECLAGSPVVDLDTGEPCDGDVSTYTYGCTLGTPAKGVDQ